MYSVGSGMQPVSQTPGSLDLTTSPRRSVLASDLALSESVSTVSSLDLMSDVYLRPSTSAEVPVQPGTQDTETETGMDTEDLTPEPAARDDDSATVAMDMTPRRPSLQSHPSSGSGATEYSVTGDSPLRPGQRSNSVQSSTTGSADVLSVGPSLSSSNTPGHSQSTGLSQSTGFSQSTGLSQSLPDSDSSLMDNTRNEARSLDLSTSGSSQATASVEEAGSLDLTKAPSVTSNEPQVTRSSTVRAQTYFSPPILSPGVEGSGTEQPSTSRMAVPAESSSSTSPRTGQPDANTAIVDMDLVGANENVANTVVIETSQGPPGSNR